MKKVVVLVAFILLELLHPRLAFADEQVNNFHSDITVQQDTSLKIVETIEYKTDDARHGIYRYIPVRYSRDGLNYTTRVFNISVTDEKGDRVPASPSYQNGNINLKIGNPDVTFFGFKTFVISYQVDNALQFIKAPGASTFTPELYWDITGEGWQMKLVKSSATIDSPYATFTRTGCYSGPIGQTDAKCSVWLVGNQQLQATYSLPIEYGDNFTVVAGFNPVNDLHLPTPTQKILKTLQDNLLMVPLLFPGVILLIWWWKRGRDIAAQSWDVFKNDEGQAQSRVWPWTWRPVPMVYQPLKELTPGQAGALHDEQVDMQDIIAEIVDLARQKLISIERVEEKHLLWTTTDYVFKKLKEPAKKLPEHQQYLLSSVFAAGDTVKLSDLKGSFYTHIEKMKTLIFASLYAKKLFTENPEKVRELGFAVACISSFLAGWWLIYLLNMGLSWSLLVFAPAVLLAFFLAFRLPAKTARGTNLAWQARGLRKSIQYGAWREKISEKHLFFEEVLPFAVALGVVSQLSRDMDKLKVKPPEYLGMSGVSTWTTASFVNSFASAASTNLTYNPSSSNWSSGSGFSGGSSGGGGGGGGGGSW